MHSVNNATFSLKVSGLLKVNIISGIQICIVYTESFALHFIFQHSLQLFEFINETVFQLYL